MADNGRGIPREYPDVVFEKVGQIKAEDYSSGLGLFFCRMAVEAHGGTIGVESEPGKGATFRFILPRGTESGAGSPDQRMCEESS